MSEVAVLKRMMVIYGDDIGLLILGLGLFCKVCKIF
jgi:hypothetical protein